eukprot:4015401-Prymnesium_polylepis.2
MRRPNPKSHAQHPVGCPLPGSEPANRTCWHRPDAHTTRRITRRVAQLTALYAIMALPSADAPGDTMKFEQPNVVASHEILPTRRAVANINGLGGGGAAAQLLLVLSSNLSLSLRSLRALKL